MPMEAARVDAEGKPVQVDLGPAPTGSGASVTNNPDPIAAPNQDFSLLSVAPSRRAAIAGNMTPTLIAGTPSPSPSNAAMTTPHMDNLYEIATNTVMRRFPTMPQRVTRT